MSESRPLDQRVMQRIKLRELRMLMAVVHEGSMSKAAAKLALSEPAISKAIAEMEHTLGVSLLDRTAQGVEPTLYGRALLKWANTVFDDLLQGVREIEFLADPTQGEIRLGCVENMNAGLVPAVIERLARQYPRVVFTVTTASGINAQIRDLRERRVDFVFGRIVSPMQDQDDLKIEILCDDPLIVVAREGSKWLRRRKIVLADLVNDPWCLSPADPDYPIGTFVAQAFKAQGLNPPRLTVRTNSPNLCYSMVGHFLSVAPASVLRMSGKRFGLKAVPIDFLIRPGPIGIITLKNRTISPVAQLFIDYARKLTKSLAKKE